MTRDGSRAARVTTGAAASPAPAKAVPPSAPLSPTVAAVTTATAAAKDLAGRPYHLMTGPGMLRDIECSLLSEG
ncbi:hypothetical protein GCM10023195_11930 [Actinoallomurus liliacearum]|uniref:Uncharacterized protein n=1 Tax=Actinoallomurus liliacearum TaxID=1080073 RepID=A0ABP8TE02_9ACTN